MARMLASLSALGGVALATCFSACTPPEDESYARGSGSVTVDTRSPEARRQYEANVAFATSYEPRCKRGPEGRPRVLVTGFGRFASIADNATGRIVEALVPPAIYPESVPPPATEIDPPAEQLSVGTTTLDLPGIGKVDVCGLILPVYWDLAAIVIAKEADALEPSLVLMNGVAGPKQPLWLELGALNRAKPQDDGSGRLRPAVRDGKSHAVLIEEAAEDEETQPNLMSWRAVEHAAREAVAANTEGVDALGERLLGAKLAGFPRASNTYLCNNVTYVVGWLMQHPSRKANLLRATPPIPNRINSVDVSIGADLSRTPRAFVHWPSTISRAEAEGGANVMRAIIAAQLLASRAGDLPTLGDNALADPTLRGGDTF